jgi:hypothetical protein
VKMAATEETEDEAAAFLSGAVVMAVAGAGT